VKFADAKLLTAHSNVSWFCRNGSVEPNTAVLMLVVVAVDCQATRVLACFFLENACWLKTCKSQWRWCKILALVLSIRVVVLWKRLQELF